MCLEQKVVDCPMSFTSIVRAYQLQSKVFDFDPTPPTVSVEKNRRAEPDPPPPPAELLAETPSLPALGLLPETRSRYHGTFAWSWWTCWFAEIAAKEVTETRVEDSVSQWMSHRGGWHDVNWHGWFL